MEANAGKSFQMQIIFISKFLAQDNAFPAF